jgi:hypothetical protein
MTFRVRRVLGAFVVLGALMGSVVSEADGAGASHESVPFTATWTGPVAITLPTTFTFAGTGTSVPMGPITAHGAAVITGLGLSCLGALVNVNVETLQATDGSLTITSHDVGCITGIGTFHGIGTWTVTGGTGRYRNAVGSGSLDGRVNIIVGTATLVANGYLVF